MEDLKEKLIKQDDSLNQEELLRQAMIVIGDYLHGYTVTDQAEYLHLKYYGHEHIRN